MSLLLLFQPAALSTAAITLLGTETFNTATGDKTVTATPTSGDLIVIVAAFTLGGGVVSTPTDNQGGAYTSITSASKPAAAADKMEVFVCTSLVTPARAVSTIYTVSDPGGITGGGLAVFRITGMTRVGLNAIRQSAIQSGQSAATTPTPVLAAAALTANALIGAVFNATNPATMTERTGYTERVDVGYDTPATGLQIMSRDSGETASSIAWGGTSASDFCSLVVELNTSPPSELVGASTLTFSTAGLLRGAGALTGASTLTFAPAGVMSGTGALAGASTLTFSPVGTLAGAGALAGASTLTFAPTGTLSGAGALVGASTLTFTPSGTLGGGAEPGAMSGASSITFATAGVLSGAGALVGASSLTFAPAGTLVNLAATSALTGSTSLTFTASATGTLTRTWGIGAPPPTSWGAVTSTGNWSAIADGTPVWGAVADGAAPGPAVWSAIADTTPQWAANSATGVWAPVVASPPQWGD